MRNFWKRTEKEPGHVGMMGRVAQVSPFRGCCFLMSLGLMLWGLWVANPFVDTFDAGFYMAMQNLASEATWATMFLISGFVFMLGVIRRDFERIRFGSLLGFILWLFVAVLYGISDPSVTPTATNTVLAALHGWVYVQVKMHPESLLDNDIQSNAL